MHKAAQNVPAVWPTEMLAPRAVQACLVAGAYEERLACNARTTKGAALRARAAAAYYQEAADRCPRIGGDLHYQCLAMVDHCVRIAEQHAPQALARDKHRHAVAEAERYAEAQRLFPTDDAARGRHIEAALQAFMRADLLARTRAGDKPINAEDMFFAHLRVNEASERAREAETSEAKVNALYDVAAGYRQAAECCPVDSEGYRDHLEAAMCALLAAETAKGRLPENVGHCGLEENA